MKQIDELLPKQPYSKVEQNWLGRMFGGKTPEGDVDGATLFEKFRVSIARWVIIWLCDNPSILASALESTKTAAAPTESAEDIVDEPADCVVLKALGFENIGQLANDYQIMRETIAKPATTTAAPMTMTAGQLVNLIIKDSEALGLLQHTLYEAGKKTGTSLAERRLSTLQNDVRGFYATRNPDIEPPTLDEVKPIAECIDASGGVRGVQFANYPGIVAKWIITQESEMGELIRSICYAKTSSDDIDAYARLLVSENTPVEVAAVRARLESEKESISLKKS